MIGGSKGLAVGAAVLALAFLAGPASAGCSVSSASVLFGSYDSLDPAPTNGVGSLHVACDAATNFVVALGPGGGSIQARRMTSGAYSLSYNLYTDASRFTLWGDGTTAGVTVSGSGTSVDIPVYGRIPARQNVAAGAYSDVVTVTLTF
jgi:spore coat protein U-like protein